MSAGISLELLRPFAASPIPDVIPYFTATLILTVFVFPFFKTTLALTTALPFFKAFTVPLLDTFRIFLSVVLKVMLFAFSLLKELASATFVFLPFFTLTEVFAAFTEERIFFSIFAAVLVSSRR